MDENKKCVAESVDIEAIGKLKFETHVLNAM